MKPFGLMADLHLHAWSAFSSTLPSGLNSRLSGLLSEIRRCAGEVKAAGGDTIVLAGDIFHVRGSVSPTVMNSTRDCLIQIYRELGVSFQIMPGNHDLESKESTRLSSAVTSLEGEGVWITNAPNYIKASRTALVPWVENIDDLKAAIAELGTGVGVDKFLRANTDLIIHAPIDGVIKGLPNCGLDPEYLAALGFKRVFAGHYHNHKCFDGSVYSIGALAHHTWSDVGTKAGYLIIHEDRVEYRKSHLPEFVDLNQLVDIEPETIPFVVDHNYVRVKVEASKSRDVEAARQELLDMGALAVIVQAQPKPPERTSTATRPTVASGASLEVSVNDFIKGMPDIDQAEVAKAAMSVLASVDSAGD
jgi:DNA repair exonuclease SbcCD nuclease subunit